jgi:hypothetical protein
MGKKSSVGQVRLGGTKKPNLEGLVLCERIGFILKLMMSLWRDLTTGCESTKTAVLNVLSDAMKRKFVLLHSKPTQT